MVKNMINLTLKKDTYQPGETLSGAVLWRFNKTPKLAEVRLLWHTQGRGNEDIEVVAVRKLPATLQGKGGFSFVLPAEPYSFSGKLITLAWTVEVVSKSPNHHAHRDFVLSPSGKEIRL